MRAMITFADFTLTWTKPKIFKSKYELRFGDELIATLCFKNIFSSAAIAESGDGCWTLEQVGFFRKRTIIRLLNSGTVIGTFRKNTWKEGGFLELANGRKFMAIASRWKKTIEFQTDVREKLIFTKGYGVFRPFAKVQMYRKCLHIPELSWMVMLGWYLIIKMKQDPAAHAAHV
jgi:hypothetical protein